MPMLISEKKQKKLRHAEYYNLTAEFDKLYEKSNGGKTFNNLMKLINCRENILLAYRNIKRNKGSHTSGVDKRTIRDLKKLSEKQMVDYVQKCLSHYITSVRTYM